MYYKAMFTFICASFLIAGITVGNLKSENPPSEDLSSDSDLFELVLQSEIPDADCGLFEGLESYGCDTDISESCDGDGHGVANNCTVYCYDDPDKDSFVCEEEDDDEEDPIENGALASLYPEPCK